MAGLTACGKQDEESKSILMDSEAQNLASIIADTINKLAVTNSDAAVIAYMSMDMGMDAAVLEGAVESWKSAKDDMGDYVELAELTENALNGEKIGDSYYSVSGTIGARIKGSNHNAILEIVYEESIPASISVNVEYTFGEKMGRAALNTLLGMGTVFTVLVLISLIIAAFGLIPKLTESKKQPEGKKTDNVVAQIAEREELSDDTELVAVIAAAIAAYEGSGSTDGFVVRSIRKAKNNRWQNA